jgi:hypothetical protein
MRCGNKTGFVIGTKLQLYPKVIEEGSYGPTCYEPHQEVYLLDILHTLCDDPYEVFVLYVPHLANEISCESDAIQFVKATKIASTYYCDLKNKGTLANLNKGIE